MMKTILNQYEYEIPELGKILPVYDEESRTVTVSVNILAVLKVAMPTEEELSNQLPSVAKAMRERSDQCIRSTSLEFFEILKITAFEALTQLADKVELILHENRKSQELQQVLKQRAAKDYVGFCNECGRGVIDG